MRTRSVQPRDRWPRTRSQRARRWQQPGRRNTDCGLRRHRSQRKSRGPDGSHARLGHTIQEKCGAPEAIRRNMRKFSFRVTFTYAALILAAPLILSAQDSQKPVATVDGQPIYAQDLMSAAGPSLLELRNQEYKVKREALDKLIFKKLVEAEAKKKGVTAEELLQQEVDSKVAAPSDEEAKGYYLAGRNQTTLPFDQIKSQ